MTRHLAALIAVLIAASAGCAPAIPGASGEPAGITLAAANVPRASASPADATAAAGAINAFGLDLYRRAAPAGTNVVVSPASIAIALSMARAGARGQTATEMDAVLRAVGSDPHAAGINALDGALAARNGSFPDAKGNLLDVTLRVANAPFAQRGLPLEQGFLDALAARFGAGLRLVDYKTNAEAARTLINRWVDDQTAGRIPELLQPGSLSDLTRLTLVNAIYLKAPWAMPFDPNATKPGTFLRAGGSTVEVPMMSLTEGLRYAARSSGTTISPRSNAASRPSCSRGWPARSRTEWSSSRCRASASRPPPTSRLSLRRSAYRAPQGQARGRWRS